MNEIDESSGHPRKAGVSLAFGRWLVRLGVPAIMVLTAVALFYSEGRVVRHELQLVVPPEVSPEQPLPIRAFLFGPGSALESEPIHLQLRYADGRLLSEQVLSPSPLGGAEGSLQLPSDLVEALVIVAWYADAYEQPMATVRTRLPVVTEPISMAMRAREVSLDGWVATDAVQRLGPVAEDASELDVRVVGGVCSSPHACRVWLRSEQPDVLMAVRSGGAGVVVESIRTVREEALWQLVRVVVPGADGTIVVALTNSDGGTSEVRFRLPTALATPAIRVLDERHEETEVSLWIDELDTRPYAVVDVFERGVWIQTQTLPTGRESVLRLTQRAARPLRLQVHSSPFSSLRSAVAWVMPPVGEDSEGRVRLLRSYFEADAASRWPSDAALVLDWLSASRANRLYQLPDALSGRAEDEAKIEARKRLLRRTALVLFSLGLLLLAFVVVRRAMIANEQARQILEPQMDDVVAARRQRRRRFLSSMILVISLLMAATLAFGFMVFRARLLD